MEDVDFERKYTSSFPSIAPATSTSKARLAANIQPIHAPAKTPLPIDLPMPRCEALEPSETP